MNEQSSVEPVVITDDELVALGVAEGKSWWRQLNTVDLEDQRDVLRATSRGYRSLGVRGLIAEDGTPHPGLLVAATCLGHRPWAVATPVTEDDRLLVEAARLTVFTPEDGHDVVWRTDPLGTHVAMPIGRSEALALLADQLTMAGDHADLRVAVTLADGAGSGLGGFIRTRAGVEEVGPTGERTGTVHELVTAEQLAGLIGGRR